MKKLNITQDELMDLWAKVKNKDKKSKERMCQMHNQIYPHHQTWVTGGNMNYDELHLVYLHLERISKK